MKTSTVDVEVIVNLKKHRKGNARGAGALKPPLSPRMPRITRLMALAIKFDEMIRRGEVRNYAELARLGDVSRARITQIMNLLDLAPDLQEHLLFEMSSCLRISEHAVRAVCAQVDWVAQHGRFHRLIEER